jgi:hypothetical protein
MLIHSGILFSILIRRLLRDLFIYSVYIDNVCFFIQKRLSLSMFEGLENEKTGKQKETK